MWILSILRARGVNSSATPGLRIEGRIELWLPPSPQPSRGLKAMKTQQQGVFEVETPQERECVNVFFFQTQGRGCQSLLPMSPPVTRGLITH